MKNNLILNTDNIKSKIYTLRNQQVILDKDLAELYNVKTKVLNQVVKRNNERFPENFMFQLTEEEFRNLRSQFVTSNMRSYSGPDSLRSQNATLNTGHSAGFENLKSQIATSNQNEMVSQNVIPNKIQGGRRYLPYVFTEQGVAMLSGVLKSDTAIKISIQIIEAFVSMRRVIAANAEVFHRLDKVEIKQIEYDKKFNEIFEAIESRDIKPEKGIFFDGQVFDSHKFISDIIRSANKSIILIDNYIDDSVLTLFSKNNVKVTIFTKDISKQLLLDLNKY